MREAIKRHVRIKDIKKREAERKRRAAWKEEVEFLNKKEN